MDEIKEEKKEEKKEEIKEETPQYVTSMLSELDLRIKIACLESRIDGLEENIDVLFDRLDEMQDRPSSSITNIFHQERGGLPLTYESIKRNVME